MEKRREWSLDGTLVTPLTTLCLETDLVSQRFLPLPRDGELEWTWQSGSLLMTSSPSTTGAP